MKSTTTSHFHKREKKPHNENVSTQADDIRRNSKEGMAFCRKRQRNENRIRKASHCAFANGRISRNMKSTITPHFCKRNNKPNNKKAAIQDFCK